MNEWIQKSIEIANAPGYLDNLQQVYPVIQEAKREIPAEIKIELERIFKEEDNLTLIRSLLKLPKFPVKDPYVAFLRKRRGIFLEYNPLTVDRIAERIRSMGLEDVIVAIEEPKEFNRQIGTLFKRWLPKIGYPVLPETEFELHEGIAFLQGSNGQLREYANSKLGCNLQKGPDLLAKTGNNYVVGEAKFLTDYGGHQNAQFEDALRLLKDKSGKAIRIAILDGVVWIKDRTKMYRTVCQSDEIILTALLLKDFLKSWRWMEK